MVGVQQEGPAEEQAWDNQAWGVLGGRGMRTPHFSHFDSSCAAVSPFLGHRALWRYS